VMLATFFSALFAALLRDSGIECRSTGRTLGV
jgi:hypothetical protein